MLAVLRLWSPSANILSLHDWALLVNFPRKNNASSEAMLERFPSTKGQIFEKKSTTCTCKFLHNQNKKHSTSIEGKKHSAFDLDAMQPVPRLGNLMCKKHWIKSSWVAECILICRPVGQPGMKTLAYIFAAIKSWQKTLLLSSLDFYSVIFIHPAKKSGFQAHTLGSCGCPEREQARNRHFMTSRMCAKKTFNEIYECAFCVRVTQTDYLG